MAFENYFDLGFAAPSVEAVPPAPKENHSPLWLGRRRRQGLEWVAWLFVAAGIFARNGLSLAPLKWRPTDLNVGTAMAALVIGLAVFPAFMRWFNRKRRRVGFEHVAAPFAFGFFLDLVTLAAVKVPPAVLDRIV